MLITVITIKSLYSLVGILYKAYNTINGEYNLLIYGVTNTLSKVLLAALYLYTVDNNKQ